MRYVKFTSHRTGRPIWIREDQVAAWYPDAGRCHLVPAFDEVDIEVKETGEEILAIMKGEDQCRLPKKQEPRRSSPKERT